MINTRFAINVSLFGAALATSIVVVACAGDATGANQPEPAELVALLESNAPAAEKAIACKQLAVFGDKTAVRALAPLLEDKRLSSWSRIALEAIPGGEADAALRQAMDSVDGRLLVGVINSIGVRRDVNAVEGLAMRLNDSDAAIASAAAVALGRIGDEQATKTLRGALAKGSTAVRSAVAEGCILSAERLLADGDSDEAAAIYDEVRTADVARERTLEATRGAILARGLVGVELMVEQLRAEDKGFFHVGLSAARELPGREAAESLAEEIANLPPQRGALLVYALADRGDGVALPVMVRSADQGAKPVRIAAVRVLQRQGDDSCLPTLLEIALEKDTELSQAAKDALSELPDAKVDADIKARLSAADARTLAVLIEIVGRRRIDAMPALLKAADHTDASTRQAALTALGETVDLDHLDVLISRVADLRDQEEATVAKRALLAACVRMPDREACAEKLAAAISQSSFDASAAILETLGAMGGDKALQAIGAAANGSDEQLQDVASRLLGEWMSVDAAPQLLALAKTPDNRFSIRALRGYIRLARQFDMPSPERAEMCQLAIDAAVRDVEQKLVLQVLERYPSVETLEVAAQAAKDPAISGEATRVSRSIERKLEEQ